MSSCCGGKCGCGADCKCGSSCGGCKMYPETVPDEMTTTKTVILGVADSKTGVETSTGGVAAAGNESDCKCNPCTCFACTCGM
ncbi:metallothionein-like protein type 2 [Bidens hawaiensis]|uniref:metallothionein-like protein type 2 n=1 Tax=Bidens hawaiensis TaxID=980011 RepID=UPI0040494804